MASWADGIYTVHQKVSLDIDLSGRRISVQTLDQPSRDKGLMILLGLNENLHCAARSPLGTERTPVQLQTAEYVLSDVERTGFRI